jgi:hypothetical protein
MYNLYVPIFNRQVVTLGAEVEPLPEKIFHPLGVHLKSTMFPPRKISSIFANNLNKVIQ